MLGSLPRCKALSFATMPWQAPLPASQLTAGATALRLSRHAADRRLNPRRVLAEQPAWLGRFWKAGLMVSLAGDSGAAASTHSLVTGI